MNNLRILLCLLAINLTSWVKADGVDWLHLMPQLNSAPTKAQVSADGALLISGSPDGILRFWEYPSGRLIRVMNSGLSAPDISPISRKVVVACSDKTGRIYNMDTGLLEITLPWHTAAINQIVYSADGLRIASASADRSIGIWNALNGDQDFALLGHAGSVIAVAFSPDGTKLASVSSSEVRIWEVATGGLIFAIPTVGTTNGLCWSANSQEVLGCVGSPRRITAWSAATGLVSREFTPNTSFTNLNLTLSPDGASLYAGFSDGSVRVFDMNSGTQVRTISNTYSPNGVSFAQGGTRLVLASSDKTVKVRDSLTGALVSTYGVDHTRNWSAKWNADGTRFLMVGEDHALRLYDRRFKLLSAANVPYAVTDIEFAPSGLAVATALPNGVISYNVSTGAVIRSYTTTGSYEVAYSPDGTLLAATVNNEVRIWDVATGALVRTLAMGTYCTSVKFSPDGTKLAVAAGDNLVHYERIFDVASGAILQTLVGHTKWCYGLNFSADGARLVTGSADKSIRVWEVASGANLLTINGHTGTVEDVAFTPDGQTLVSSGAEQTLKFWNANTGELIRDYDNSNYSAPYHLIVSPDGSQVAIPGLISGIVRTPRMIYGKALLGDYIGPRLGESLSVQVWQNGNLVETLDGTYAEDGSYGVWPSVTGSLTLKFKLRNSLRKAVNVTLGTTELTGIDVVMTNGDSDGSGEIDAADIDAVIADFGGTSVSADVDGSNEVDAVDIDIVIAHFGSVDD